MTEKEFIEKWIADEQGFWIESACALFWARSYGMPREFLTAMSNDYLSVPIENRAPCSEYLSLQWCTNEPEVRL